MGFSVRGRKREKSELGINPGGVSKAGVEARKGDLGKPGLRWVRHLSHSPGLGRGERDGKNREESNGLFLIGLALIGLAMG
ncbi:hypothetical protein MAPG_05404 [Magnaporthiopsis poae ATCC 64411]|uniref:Uncharacterized protein n=1 Tax=Magnaporthiopsis poae (strain ATCC 64411 / 73-15) TaxID=644358 RepID=A0A0C4DZA9_MAGP6|nr:hypothetical protein MAPG_05404 [Magnaporthiopsis poae ATCC 64411]